MYACAGSGPVQIRREGGHRETLPYGARRASEHLGVGAAFQVRAARKTQENIPEHLLTRSAGGHVRATAAVGCGRSLCRVVFRRVWRRVSIGNGFLLGGHMKPARVVIVALAWLAVMPSAALAQSAIAGVVKDASGAVMPGVTVEASSPALIEKSRTAVTDDHGQYKIVDLRPGTYTVVFTLPGFNTSKREGIELPANFTAPVNAELRIGAIEESVTVSALSPVVDVQQAVTQQVLPQTLLDAVPMGGRNIQSVGATLVGVTQSAPDVGGAQGMQQNYIAAHGSDPRDNYIMIDGIRLNGIEGDGAIQQYFNEGMFSEMSYQTAGISAESSGGGVRLNMIPKVGGNTFKADLFFSATGQG